MSEKLKNDQIRSYNPVGLFMSVFFITSAPSTINLLFGMRLDDAIPEIRPILTTLAGISLISFLYAVIFTLRGLNR